MRSIKRRISRISESNTVENSNTNTMMMWNYDQSDTSKIDLTNLKSELNVFLDNNNEFQPRLDSVAKRKGSTDSILDGMSAIESNVYSSIVCLPVVPRSIGKCTKQKILSKFAGVPFALLYGIFLYALLRYVFYPVPFENCTSLNATVNVDIPKHVDKVSYFGAKHQREHVTISTVFAATLGVASVASKGTRCSLLLILPCVITGRSRAFLSTFIMSLLVDGPIHNLGHNYNEISRKSSCTYDALLNLTQKCIGRINDATKSLIGSKDDKELNFNFTFPQVEAIRSELTSLQSGVNGVLRYAAIVRKILTAISLLLLIIDAMQYLKCYYSDNSFDNIYVSTKIREYWDVKKYERLTPLRHWELNEGYRTCSSAKFTKREFTKIARKLIPTIMFSLFVVLAMMADYLLAKVLLSTADKQNVDISFEGIEKILDGLVKKMIEEFANVSKNCAAHPLTTSSKTYTVISFLLIIASLSCIFEVYMSRVRSRMCNVFYTKRAKERAEYLRYRIIAGRMNRRVQLKLTITRALDRQKRLIEFYPCTQFSVFCRFLKSKGHVICPGCEWSVRAIDTLKESCVIGDQEVEFNLCNDCCREL